MLYANLVGADRAPHTPTWVWVAVRREEVTGEDDTDDMTTSLTTGTARLVVVSPAEVRPGPR
jgi:hypothetical protein